MNYGEIRYFGTKNEIGSKNSETLSKKQFFVFLILFNSDWFGFRNLYRKQIYVKVRKRKKYQNPRQISKSLTLDVYHFSPLSSSVQGVGIVLGIRPTRSRLA